MGGSVDVLPPAPCPLSLSSIQPWLYVIFTMTRDGVLAFAADRPHRDGQPKVRTQTARQRPRNRSWRRLLSHVHHERRGRAFPDGGDGRFNGRDAAQPLGNSNHCAVIGPKIEFEGQRPVRDVEHFESGCHSTSSHVSRLLIEHRRTYRSVGLCARHPTLTAQCCVEQPCAQPAFAFGETVRMGRGTHGSVRAEPPPTIWLLPVLP